MIIDFFKYLRKYFPLISEHKSNLIKFLIFSLLIIFISILTPYLTSKIIIYMLEQKYFNIIYIILLFGLLRVFYLVFSLLCSKIFLELRKNFIFNLKKCISNSILNFDLKKFSINKKGKFIQRINNDPNIIADCLLDLRRYFVEIFINIGVIVYIFILNYYIGFIYMATFLIVLYIRIRGIVQKKNYQKHCYNEQEKTNTILTEMFNGIKDVKLLNLKKTMSNKTNSLFNNVEDLQYKANLKLDIYIKLTFILEWLSNALVIFISINLILNNKMTTNDFITIFIYRNSIFSFLDSVTYFLDLISAFNLASDRVFELISVEQPENIKENKSCIGKIEFKNVSFKYDKKLILNNCNFIINENSFVAIKGKSGVGKTTILNLITGICKVNSGKILIDDVDINSLSDYYLRKNISIVSQDFYLFDMSIKDNLWIVKPEATEQEIIDICKKVKIHDFIETLPNKYDTIIGEGGQTLSGGQKQRLALARALLLNTKIILFDEVTSSMDDDLENFIFSIIENLKDEHTILFVTHKTKLIKKFDEVLFVNNGLVKK